MTVCNTVVFGSDLVLQPSGRTKTTVSRINAYSTVERKIEKLKTDYREQEGAIDHMVLKPAYATR